MSEKEKDIGRKLSETMAKLDRENQKYILGMAEGMAMSRKTPQESREKDAVCV